MNLRSPQALIASLFLLFTMPVVAQTITIAGPTTSSKTFPADQPPADLRPGEAADATLAVETVGGVIKSITWNSATSTLTVAAVDTVSVMATIAVRLPDNASQALKDHENGHTTLLTEEYHRVANSITETALRGLVGNTFTGAGATDAERKANALAQAMADRDLRLDNATQGISSRANELNAKYDDLTAHGTSATVNTVQGMVQARQERDRALQAGNAARQPAPRGPKAGGADPPTVTYDPGSHALIFSLLDALTAVTLGEITTSSDALISTRAQATVTPMRIVGVQADGTVMFDPSELSIYASNSRVLHGYLLDPVYMPSSVPGFSGMIQANLDIPPAFTGSGIVNTIGSGFLSAFQGVLETPSGDSVPTFWFFTDQRLFADSIEPMTLSSSGVLEFGVSAQEPGTIPLLAVAFGCLLVFAVSRKHSEQVGFCYGQTAFRLLASLRNRPRRPRPPT